MGEKLKDGTVLSYKAGTQLICEGEHSRKMFIIQKGKARVYRTYMGERVTLAILGAGEVFGELSFFDAEPRSASVEALTDLDAIVVDGEVAAKEVAGLPGWVFPILRTTFHRFREADRKITILQSMNDFQKRAFKTDNVGRGIYLELMRFIKTMKLLYKNWSGKKISSSAFYKELDDVLGQRLLGLRVFWRKLKEYHFMDNEKEENEGVVILNLKAIDEFNEYLANEVNSERYLLLSHTAVAILRRVVGGFSIHSEPGEGSDEAQGFSISDLQIESLPFHLDSLNELQGKGLVQVEGDTLIVYPDRVGRIYVYQEILKSFDHSSMNVE